MITAIVQFELASAITLAEATRRFEMSAPKYQNLAGLIRKYYIRSEDGRTAGGVYLWESRQAAERVYDDEWRERVEKLYGSQAEDHLVRQLRSSSTISPAAPSPRQHDHAIRRQRRGATHFRPRPRAAAAVATAAAAQPARAKGPIVWLDMDQQQLDDAYDQVVYAPNREQVGKRRVFNSERARARHRRAAARGLWADRDREARHLPHQAAERAGQHLRPRRRLARATAPPTTRSWPSRSCSAGAHYVILDFINVDEAGGSLFPMVEQVRRAVGWVYRNAKSFGGDPDRLYLTVAFVRLASRRLRGDARLAQGRAARSTSSRARLLGSGMYDLKPVRLSKRSKYVKFTDEMEEALSAQRHLDRLHTPLVLAHGTYETPEFQRQTRDFAAAVKAAGKPVELLVGEGYNHFEMLETLANPYGLLGRAVLAQMRLSAARVAKAR